MTLAEGCNVSLEELARQMIRSEELDVVEIEKCCAREAMPRAVTVPMTNSRRHW